MAGGRTIQCGDRRRRALAVAIQRPANSPRGGTGRTVLHGDRDTDGHARFRSHSPDVRSGSRRTRCARYRFQRSPSQHQSDHCRGEGPASSSRSGRGRRREANAWSSRSYSTHRPPRPAGRLRTTPTLGAHMTHRSRFPALLLPFALLASTPRVEHPAEEQLRALLATYETSLNAGDAGEIEQLYAVDGVFMPAGFPTASGRPAVPVGDESPGSARAWFEVPRDFDVRHNLVKRANVDVVPLTVRVPHDFELATAALTAWKAVYC